MGFKALEVYTGHCVFNKGSIIRWNFYTSYTEHLENPVSLPLYRQLMLGACAPIAAGPAAGIKLQSPLQPAHLASKRLTRYEREGSDGCLNKLIKHSCLLS